MKLPHARNGTTKLAAGLSIFKSDSIKAGTAALTTLSPSFSLYLISFPQSFSFDARAVMSASLSPSLIPSFRSRDIKEEKMANILRYIERQLGREVHLERDGMGRWAIPHELVASSGIPFDQ